MSQQGSSHSRRCVFHHNDGVSSIIVGMQETNSGAIAKSL